MKPSLASKVYFFILIKDRVRNKIHDSTLFLSIATVAIKYPRPPNGGNDTTYRNWKIYGSFIQLQQIFFDGGTTKKIECQNLDEMYIHGIE